MTTTHFEMYTTNGERQGAAALRQFEQVRYFFLQSSPSKSAPDATVRIIAFRSEKEYQPYRLNGGAFAYYLRSRKVDYIVMQDISSEHYQTAAHEYTHLIVQHLGLQLPVWLNEGLADIYSSLEPRGNQALVGRPLEGRQVVLMNERWLDLNTLFAVTPESPYYNESNKMSISYAESWALTHMLALGKNYRPGFLKFLAASTSGRSTAECLQTVYGKTPAEVMKDLAAYVHQSSVQAAIYDVKLKSAELEPQLSDAPELNVQLALADLLGARTNTARAAAERLSKLAREYPESADVQESLGYFAWEQGNKDQARACAERAIEKGSQNPEMMLQYAGLLQEAQAPPDQILSILQKAADLKPDNADAWFDLGMVAVNARRWSTAIIALSHLHRVSEERAYPLFSALAYCDLQMKEFKSARENASKARQYARTPEQTLQISLLIEYLDKSERPSSAAMPSKTDAVSTMPAPEPGNAPAPALAKREVPRDQPSIRWPGELRHVEGIAKSLACDAKIPRLHVSVEGKEMVFELADPKGIVVRNVNGGQVDLHCARRKRYGSTCSTHRSAAPRTSMAWLANSFSNDGPTAQDGRYRAA